MAPTLVALLKASQEHDAKDQAVRVRINKAVMEAGTVEATTPPPAHELDLSVEEEDDPFQGNINNRNAAERIAKSKHRLFLNNSEPTHVGDPVKALADIERSRRINPDPPVKGDDEPLPDIVLPPTPGSPAARKAAAKATTAAPLSQGNDDAEKARAAAHTEAQKPENVPGAVPQTWKPNA